MAFEQIPPSKRFAGYVFLFFVSIALIFFALSTGMSIISNKKYVIYFDQSITGLRVGSCVCYKGVNVGSIRSIEIDLPTSNRIKVIVKIKRTIPIYKGCVAKIATQGLVSGVYSLDLCNPNDETALIEGIMPEITSVVSEVEEAVKNIPGVIVKIGHLVDAAHGMIRNNKSKVNAGVGKVTTLLETIDKIINEVLNGAQQINSSILPQLAVTIADMKHVTYLIREDVENLSKAGTALTLSQIIYNLGDFTSTLNESSKNNSFLRNILAG